MSPVTPRRAAYVPGTGLSPSLVAAVGALLVMPTSPARAQAVQFEIQFTEVREGQGDQWPVPRSVAVTLRGGNRIVASESVGGRRFGRQRQSEAVLGRGYRLYDDAQAVGEWQVGSGNTLVRKVPMRTDTEILVVKPIGPKDCAASISFILFPGERFHRRPAGMFDRIRAENVSCRVL